MVESGEQNAVLTGTETLVSMLMTEAVKHSDNGLPYGFS